jgi:opacity protein-like surface antigen
MKNILLYYCVLLFSNVVAQRSSTSINWSISNGTGNTASFIDKTSFNGGAVDFTYFPQDQLGFFIESGWNFFSQKVEKATYTEQSISVTGVQFRELKCVPILAGIHYEFLPEASFNPYCNLGFGTIYQTGTITMGLFVIDNDIWQWAYKPEAGVKIQLNQNLSGKLGAKYYRTFETEDLDAQSFWTFNLGLSVEIE